MPRVRYLLANGSERVVDAPAGHSVMLAAIQNNVPGIEAQCGGSLDCATCHVYVNEAYFHRLPPPSPDEAELLEGVAAGRRPASGLSCQILVTNKLDELAVRIPARQL